MNKKIYIIILNFKGHLDTVECLESCLKLDYSNFEIIVVDNSPTNNSIQYIIDWANGNLTNIDTNFKSLLFPFSKKPISLALLEENELKTRKIKTGKKITLIKANSNRGFAAGNNLGIRYAFMQKDLSYIWLLNNDTVVDNMALSLLVEKGEKTGPETGLIGNTLLYYHAPGVIQALGGKYNPYFGRTKHIKEGEKLSTLKIPPVVPEYVVGASMFLRKETLEKIGHLNEEYFLYYEEIDYALRLKHAGMKIGFEPKSIVYHKEGKSIGANSKEKNRLSEFYNIRNRIIINRRYYNKFSSFTLLLVYLLILLKKILLDREGLKPFFKAFRQGINLIYRA